MSTHFTTAANPVAAAPPPIVFCYSGLDPSGGAGLLADIKTVFAHRCYGAGVVTAQTVQNTQGVYDVQPVVAQLLARQLAALAADMRPTAVKIGMLGEECVIIAVADNLTTFATPAASAASTAVVKTPAVVLDTVLRASHGADLLDPAALDTLKLALLPMVTVLTPNLHEAVTLLGLRSSIETRKDAYKAAEKLRELLNHNRSAWVYLKGGHLPGDVCIDFLTDGDQMIELPQQRIDSPHTHGTGCALASSLASLLAHGYAVPRAAQLAQAWVRGSIVHAQQQPYGQGHSGVCHHWQSLGNA